MNHDEFVRAGRAVARHMLLMFEWMNATKLKSWSAARWQDMALAAQWLVDHAKELELREDELKGLEEGTKRLMQQGFDWVSFLSLLNVSGVANAWHHPALFLLCS